MKTKHKYQQLPWPDKVLDAFLIVGVIASIIFFVAEAFFSPGRAFVTFGHGFDVFLIGLLMADMSRHFLRSRSFLDFAKHYWLDVVLFVVVIISFSSLLYIGLGRLSWLIREEQILGGASKVLRLNFLGKIFK